VTVKAKKGRLISLLVSVFIVWNGFPESNHQFMRLGLWALMVWPTTKRSRYRNQLHTRCGCHHWSCRCANHEVIWENVGRPTAPFVLQVGIRWKVIRQLHAQIILPSEKQPAVHNAYEAGGDPVTVCTLWSRLSTLLRPAIERQFLRLPLVLYLLYWIPY
jgi:hypothetical protein